MSLKTNRKQPSRVRAYNDIGWQLIPQNIWTTVIFNAKLYDPTNEYSNVTYRFTAKYNSFYRYFAKVGWLASGVQCLNQIRVRHTTLGICEDSSVVTQVGQISENVLNGFTFLNVGQQIWLEVRTSILGGLQVNTGTYISTNFQIEKIT